MQAKKRTPVVHNHPLYESVYNGLTSLGYFHNSIIQNLQFAMATDFSAGHRGLQGEYCFIFFVG